MGDNGEIKNKTPEELAKERLDRYIKDPDSFTENSEIIVAVKRASNGLMYKVSGTAQELEIIGINLFRKILNALNMLEMSAEMKKKELLTPKHGIIDFMRRK